MVSVKTLEVMSTESGVVIGFLRHFLGFVMPSFNKVSKWRRVHPCFYSQTIKKQCIKGGYATATTVYLDCFSYVQRFSVITEFTVYLCIMKLLQFLLAIYVVLLSVLPCEAFCSEEQDAHGQSKTECCSPFSLCSTCFGFTIPQAQTFVTSPLSVAFYSVSTPTLYEFFYSLDVLGGIWQPPRLD